jgi:hypothetical protein
LPIANGGTGQTTAAAAITALSGTQTSGYYLRSNGTNTALAAIVAGDVPTLNQNTTGTAANITASSNATLTTLSALSLAGSQVTGNISGNAANVTGTVAIANGGTGQTTANAAFNALVPSQTSQSGKYLTTDGTNTSWAANPLGTVTSVGGTGTVSGISLSGTVTTSGNLTLGGSLNLSSPPAIGNTAPSTGNFTTLTENSVAVVTQSDIGSAPNEIPLNQYLGSLAYQNGDAYYNTGMTVGFRNRIINGQMQIDQRNAGATVNQINGAFNLDRWSGNSYNGGGATGKFSVGQSGTAPTGFSNSLLVTSLSASATTTSDIYNIEQKIEGFNFADFMYGTANAQTLTLSFWVRSSITGTFGGALKNSARNRAYPFTYTINSANAWEQKTLVIGGDTSGTWVGSTNGVGLWVSFGLGVGTSFTEPSGLWGGGDQFSADGCVSLISTNGATWYITGVQLEKGNIATSFDVRPYGTELNLCQRYYFAYLVPATCPQGFGHMQSTTVARIIFPNPVPMRATPTFTPLGSLGIASGGTSFIASASSVLGISSAGVQMQFDVSGATTHQTCVYRDSGGTSFSAEL